MAIEFKPSAADETSAHLDALIGVGMREAAAQDTRDKQRADYIGGSQLGEECERKLGYAYHGAEKDPDREFSNSILRVFQRGHAAEDRMAKYLRGAGFDLRTEKPDGAQFGFYAARDPVTGNARIRGHLDGVIVGWKPTHEGPWDRALYDWASGLAFPMLWENKCLNNKNFNAVKKHGLAKQKPLYYAQINLYMAYFEVDRALFTIENADTCEIWADVMELDVRLAQEASDRGVRIVSSRAAEELPKLRTDGEYPCTFCDFKARCAASPDQASTKPAVMGGNWMA